MNTKIILSGHRAKSLAGFAAAGACILTCFSTVAQTAGTTPPAAILQELREFRTFGTVLMVAAHPDDEDRPLLAFLSKSCDFRTGYLSINRGDGGQNEIGPEFDAKLGVIRTQELLAGRRIDGAQQFFTRAIDFGYSKSMDETLRIWDHQAVLGDVVRVIRTFRPDVIITRFAPVAQPGNHGHHNASALLAVEAFKIAGDSNSYPEQIVEGLAPWQPVRIVQDGGNNGLSISGGNTDPVTGETVQAIATRTSAQHKTQGVGGFGGRGGRGGSNSDFRAGFTLLAGAPGTNLMDGVDLTWSRVPNGGDQIAMLADEIISRFDPNHPDDIMKLLNSTRVSLASLPADPLVAEKRKLLETILQHCLGVSVVTTVPQAEVVAGEELKFHSTVTVQTKVPLFWLTQPQSAGSVAQLKPGEPAARDVSLKLPADMPVTEPYWLREDPTPGMFRVDDSRLIGRPETPPALLITNRFQIGDSGGPIFEVVTEPVQAGTESGTFEARRALKIIPPVSLHCEEGVRLFTPGSSRTVTIAITASRENVTGDLSLAAPDGWKVSPEQLPFSIASAGGEKKFSFTVTAPRQAANAEFTARAKIGDKTFDNDRIVISYSHIPMQLLQPTARVKAVSLEFAIRGKNVGYLPGAGDDTAADLAQLGYAVTTLTGSDLTTNRLKDFDAVVIGVRAFNERTDLAANFPALLAWVEQGGTVIAQYNRPNGLRTQQLGPYPLSIQGQAPPLRVTDENAPVTFLLPDHPALNVPNKITAADFDGWVQERGAYFASQWDDRYAAPLAMSDPGETQPNSSLLIAQAGNGYYVYTSLAFFRQLPAGVPGAYRLFANLVSLGK